jgi:hypothetical protein
MKYRKPRSLNWVSFMLLGCIGLTVYLLYCFWPVYSTRSRVAGILYDHLPLLYRANLRSDEVARAMIEDIKASIANELKKAGINDKAAKIQLRRNPKEISLEVRYKTRVHFPFPEKTYEFEIAPKVVSDATRVEW